jgi:cytochrome c oxidase cbb3-type subunit 3
MSDRSPGAAAIADRSRRAGVAAVLLASICAIALGGCEVEKRRLGPSPPASPPVGTADRRAELYASNRHEASEGGRMFHWFACDACHTDPAPGDLDLADAVWRRGGSVPAIYQAIATGGPGMPAYAGRIPPEQIWQIAGYVHGLHELKPSQRRRNANAQQGEPSGSSWTGPL